MNSGSGTRKTLTQDQMRQEIREQRRIEFAFEAKRFYDIIRWKTAKTLMNLDLHGMKIENSVPATNGGVWVYTPIGLNHPHVFTDKMYMNPIPQGVVDVNPKIKTQQNPGIKSDELTVFRIQYHFTPERSLRESVQG